MPKLSKSDKAFLRSVGIKPTSFPPTFAEQRLALAERIAKHAPPQECDAVVRFLRENGLPVNRETYLAIAYLGNPPEEIGPEVEAELPWFLQHSEEE